jgi:hypothetical protein
MPQALAKGNGLIQSHSPSRPGDLDGMICPV